jgi:flagellar basal-body rod protein FlgG
MELVFRGIYAGTSAMLVQEKMLDVVGNNLANVDTSGFRARIGVNKSFPEELMDRIEKVMDPVVKESFVPGGRITIGDLSLANVLHETAMRTAKGAFERTGSVFDLAIDGDGFFVVQDGAGNTFYTRSGHFQRNEQGQLVTHDGMLVMGDGGPIEIGEGVDVHIGDDGQVFVDGEAQGRIRVVRFATPSRLRQEGKSLLSETQYSGAPEDVEDVKLAVGFLERSNVNVVEEMTKMIEANRAYEAAAKTVTIQDELSSRLSNSFGRPS